MQQLERHKAEKKTHEHKQNGSRLRMIESLILVLLLIVGIMGFVFKINSSLREDTESSIKSMTKIGADFIVEYTERDQRSLAELASLIALLPEDERLEKIQASVNEDTFNRMALVYADGSGFLNDGSPISSESDLEYAHFPEGSAISKAAFGWNGHKQVVMRTEVPFGDGQQAMLYGYVDLEDYYVPAAMAFLDGRCFAYVIDKESGEYLVYPKNTIAQRTYASLYTMLEKSGNADASLQEIRDLMKTGQAGSIVLNTEGQDNYFYFAPVDNQQGWYMVAIVPLEVIQQSSNTILVLVSLLCLFTLICVIGLMLMENSRNRTQALAKEREYSDKLFGMISENVEQVFMVFNGQKQQMEMVFSNALQVLGLDAEACQKEPMLFFTRCESDALQQAAKQMLLGTLTNNVSEECRYQHMISGKMLWLEVKLLHISDQDNDLQYIVAVEDQTKERESRSRLDSALRTAEKASKAKSEFLSAMSHDIRTPMNAIMGMTELALLQADCPERIRDLLEKISSSSRHLLSLINDILDMSRIESGKLSIGQQPLSIREEIARVSTIIQSQAEERHQTFLVRVGALEQEMVYGDALRVNQILINILGNSVKFTPEGGTIRWDIAELADEPGWVRVRHVIADTGIGIRPEFLPHLFEAFEQENRHGGALSGSGLGMAITKNLVDLMGGTIAVESTLGQGTTFIVELRFPIKADAEETKTAPLSDQAAQSHEPPSDMTILLVDDNALNREIAIEMLAVFGIKTETAENGELAVQKFADREKGHYQAILMDIQMPVMDGYTAARAIRALDREDGQTIPIIAMTADAFAEDIQHAKEAGMNAHVAKPVDFDQLYLLLQELL